MAPDGSAHRRMQSSDHQRVLNPIKTSFDFRLVRSISLFTTFEEVEVRLPRRTSHVYSATDLTGMLMIIVSSTTEIALQSLIIVGKLKVLVHNP
jgi:hypothetical protein